MNAARVSGALTIAGLVGLAILFSVLLLQSSELGVGLFVVGVVLMMLVVEPFIGLLVYILFIFTGPQAYIPALAGMRIMLVIGGATLVSMLARNAIIGAAPRARVGPTGYLLLWFLVAVVASHLAHLEFLPAIGSGADILSHLILFLLIVKLVTNKDRLRLTLSIVFLGTVLLAVQGVVQHYTGTTLIETPEFKGGRIAGVGHFVNPNMLAIGLVCGLPIGYSLMMISRSGLIRAATVAGMALSLFALYLTNSRSGTLSLAVVLAIAFVRRFGLWRGILLGAGAFALVFQFGPSRMEMMSTTEESTFGRLLAWDLGYRIFFENPIFGAGADSWYDKYRALVAHNSFIHCAAELGLFGLFPWVIMQFVSARNLWFVSKQPEETEESVSASYANGVFLSFAAFIFASFFISKTYNVLLFILIGLATAVVNMYVNDSRHKFVLVTRGDLAIGAAATILGLIAFRAFLAVVGVGG